MIVFFKEIQFARLRATNKNAKNEKGANLKELPRTYKLPQSALDESVEGGVKLSKTCLPPVGPPCHPKILEKGWPPQRHCFPTIGKDVSPHQMEKESPSHVDTFLRGTPWKEHVVRHQVKVANGLNSILPPQHVDAQLHT